MPEAHRSGARILVIDDDPVSLRFVSSMLREKGYDVLVAEDGEHGCRLAIREQPDLIVSDLIMPYRNGFQLVREIRAHKQLAHTPVVLLSMRDREEDIVRGLEEGADDYVIKPFNARELLARIRKQLDRVGGIF
jgi:DNA-binding response OmpR family regulator